MDLENLDFSYTKTFKAGVSMRTNDLSVSFLKKGLVALVGAKDEQDAITLCGELLGGEAVAESHKFNEIFIYL